MAKRTPYHTRQREAVLACFARKPGTQLSAAQVVSLLEDAGEPAGRTTVYRTIAWLSQNGHLISYRDPKDPGGMRFSLRGQGQRHVSVVCSQCGCIAPLACEEVEAFQRHLSLEHGFTLSQENCVLPGLCRACGASQNNPQNT